MGKTQNYLAFEKAGICNIIGGSWAGIQLLPSESLPGRKDSLACVGACENVYVWDLRTGEKVKEFEGKLHMVTSIARGVLGQIAVGYQNGVVTIFSLNDTESDSMGNSGTWPHWQGHKTSVSCLAFDADEGLRLASGGKDTDIIIYDLVEQKPLYRLKGHTNEITQLRFIPKRNLLVSSSRDTKVKFWDLDEQHCFKTLTHSASVGGFIFFKNYSFMVTGSASEDLKVWKLEYIENDVNGQLSKKIRLSVNDDDDEDEEEKKLKCTVIGTITKECKTDVLSMSVSAEGNVFGCHGNEKRLAVYRIRSDDEVEKRLKKRTKKLKKQAIENGQSDTDIEATLTSEDLVEKIKTIGASFKMRAFECVETKNGKVKIVALLKDNSIEEYKLDYKQMEKAKFELKAKFSQPGHRNEIHTLSFSSDNSAILSGSSESIRIWNRSSLKCIRSFASGYATCSAFVFGDRHVVVGTRSGELEIYDVASGERDDSIDAHEGIVRSICLTTDKRGLASGGEDKKVILWDFDYVLEESEDKTKPPRRKVMLVPKKKVEMADVVLCVKYSQDMKYFAASLLDAKIYIFLADTMKPFLTLYDHQFAVTSIDISSDNELLISGSTDKSIHIYDLQFGETKSIIKCAHEDQVNVVKFLPNKHLFFSSSNDGTVKYWDADIYQNLLVLRGHHNQVSCLTISPNGNFVASAASDKSLRLWEKTDRIMELGEEKELEREKAMDENESEEIVIPGELGKEAVIAVSRNAETETSADKIIEALENHKHADKMDSCLPKPAGVLDVLKDISPNDLEPGLLLLPFSYVQELLPLLATFIEEEAEVELPWHCAVFLLRVHVAQITSSQVLRPVLEKLRGLRHLLKQERELINFNRCGLQFLKQKLEERDSITFFADTAEKIKEHRKRRVRRRTVMSIKA